MAFRLNVGQSVDAPSPIHALDARCYEGGEDRTHLHEQRLGRRDAVATAITLAFLAALVALG